MWLVSWETSRMVQDRAQMRLGEQNNKLMAEFWNPDLPTWVGLQLFIEVYRGVGNKCHVICERSYMRLLWRNIEWEF